MVEQSPVFARSLSGFSLVDPADARVLSSVLSDHYFTPASNTKILTLAACLELLGDSIPGMRFTETHDTLIFRGTGDPTFLHPKFQYWQSGRDTLLAARQDSLVLCYAPQPFPTKRFGPGWAWDDYSEDYQPERSEMPIYGNCVQISRSGIQAADIQPPFFRDSIQSGFSKKQEEIVRPEFENRWYVPSRKHSLSKEVPIYKPRLDLLLSDTLKWPVNIIENTATSHHPARTLYSAPVDTVLRRMMYQSDNFIAEQMLLLCAGEKLQVLQQDTLIQFLLDSLWSDLPQRPRWVDGSGLSRYNLNTPANLCHILLRLWREKKPGDLLRYFPAGGVDGTLKGWYAASDGKPYLFAKSGSMSGVYCLSGYIRCKSGKYLIFSFMHNNFVGSNKPWKAETQRVLEAIRDRF